MRLTGDARRRVMLAEIEAVGEARRLERELECLHQGLAAVRRMSRHERIVREGWHVERIPYVARALADARARAARLADDLAE